MYHSKCIATDVLYFCDKYNIVCIFIFKRSNLFFQVEGHLSNRKVNMKKYVKNNLFKTIISVVWCVQWKSVELASGFSCTVITSCTVVILYITIVTGCIETPFLISLIIVYVLDAYLIIVYIFVFFERI